MPDEHRLTLRLTPDLYAQLQARGSHGQPLAAILREALVDYLARPPGQPPPAAMADDLAAMRTRLESIEQRLGALEATAAPRQTQARQPARPRPTDMAAMTATTASTAPLPTAAMTDTADTTAPGYDPTRFALGVLCPRGHAYQHTGQTLRRLPSHVCPACDVEQQRERRQAKREGEVRGSSGPGSGRKDRKMSDGSVSRLG